MVVTDVLAHSHIECDFWISTFCWEAVKQPVLICYRSTDINNYIPEAQSPKRVLTAALILYHASYQFSHATLLPNTVLTLVMEAHLAGFAAEAVLRRVSRQEHHMLGCCAWYIQTKRQCRELESNCVLTTKQQVTEKKSRGDENIVQNGVSFIYSLFLHSYS